MFATVAAVRRGRYTRRDCRYAIAVNHLRPARITSSRVGEGGSMRPEDVAGAFSLRQPLWSGEVCRAAGFAVGTLGRHQDASATLNEVSWKLAWRKIGAQLSRQTI